MTLLSKENVSPGDIYIFADVGPRGHTMMIPAEVTRVDGTGFFDQTNLRREEGYYPFFGFDISTGILIKRASLKVDIADSVLGDDFFSQCLRELKKK